MGALSKHWHLGHGQEEDEQGGLSVLAFNKISKILYEKLGKSYPH